MTRASPIADALKRCREAGHLGPLEALLKLGYECVEDEWALIRAFKFPRARQPNPETEERLERKRAAVARYHELRTDGIAVDAAVEQVGQEFNYTSDLVRYLKDGKDSRL